MKLSKKKTSTPRFTNSSQNSLMFIGYLVFKQHGSKLLIYQLTCLGYSLFNEGYHPKTDSRIPITVCTLRNVFSYISPKLWNDIPLESKKATSIDLFKIK